MGLLRVDRLWADGRIPWVIEKPEANEEWAAAASAAIVDWMTKTELDLVPRTTEWSHVRFRLTSGGSKCTAGGVGNEGHGEQVLRCSNTTAWGLYAHEFAHSIGFGHEHQRHDRNAHVEVDSIAALKDPYDILATPGQWRAFGDYDCTSVSHYRPDDALKPRTGGCTRIGTLGGASEGDVASVRAAYGLTPAAGLLGPQSALSRGEFSLDVFVRWPNDNAVHTATWPGQWKGWWRVDPPQVSPSETIARSGVGLSAPTAVSRTAETIDVFVRQLDDSLAAASWDGHTWSHWQPLGGSGLSRVGAAVDSDTTVDLAVRGLNNRIYTTVATAGTEGLTAATWQPVGSERATSDVEIVRSGPGQLNLVTRGVDGRIVANRRAPGTGWQAWQPVGQDRARLGTHPVAVSRRGGTVDVVIIDDDLHVKAAATHDAGATWAGWWPLGDLVVDSRSALAMVSRSPQTLDVFAIDPDRRVWTARWDGGVSDQWQAWKPVLDLRAARASGLAVTSRHPSHLDLFVVAEDGRTWTAGWADGHWQGRWPVADT